ncbi:synaptotagmin-3 [Alligator mississippiensis]|uniref:Synaptotagmin-3 n=1 Tax=Alligator mississippiensis TaxID=8496 RepID=A0A151NSQ7_ALLMI|nr:synaptotagmin-3 [Alligator mississippiensis]XP_059584219.1 synaptotagmin-3 [Alligator mississippiensis]XP_059584220.1 synaptotagmin-3 [Alligator mississippiensis]KYO39901.1 synaptotagmin-3 [Alligator mississippiensis]
MSGDYEEDVCRSALTLVKELCFSLRALEQHEKCLEFTDLLRNRGHPRPTDADISVSLLSVIVTFCGIVLLGVSLFVSWKLCWIPWRDKGASQTPRKDHGHLHHSPFGDLLAERVELGPEMPERSYLDMDSYPEATLKLSQTSPDLPVEKEGGGGIPNAHSHQQVASLAPAPRYNTLPRPMTQQLSSPDVGSHGGEDKPEQVTSIGQIKPELYRQRSGEAEHRKAEATPCGRISFALRYAYASEQLVVKILRALDLPAKDANGFSDPYVKMYLLPDRKKKFQTKVHRKTLNPVFNETFSFNVPFAELPSRKLHFSVYDFDRFSRHDLIGQVVLDNLLEMAERDDEAPIWRDILEASSEKADLGEVNFSLCYLPTAGRLTVTIIRASNLKAMDLTGFSDPYVKASLMCEGRRLKKRKTSIKKNTLNPSYNEALVFDIPNESMEHVSLTIAVMDYDCIGHNEVIGMCRVGSDAEGPGREHWAEMLANPRKPIEHWHQLVEEKTLNSQMSKSAQRDKPTIVVESVHSD